MLVRTVGHIVPKEASSVRSAARSWNVPKLPPSVSARIAVMRFRAAFTVVAVKAPGFGDRRKEMLRDIAILTGGEVITSELGLELKDASLAELGRARQVKVTKENTIIVGGNGDKTAIADRVNQIRQAIESTTSEFDKEKLLRNKL